MDMLPLSSVPPPPAASPLAAPAARPWVIPGLMRRGDLVTASGPGAALVMRHMAVHLTAGASTWAGYPISGRPVKVSIIDRKFDSEIGNSLRCIALATGQDPERWLHVCRTLLRLDAKGSITTAANDCRDAPRAPSVAILDDLGAALGSLDPTVPADAVKVFDALMTLQAKLGGCPLIVLSGPGGFLNGLADAVITTRRSDRGIGVKAVRIGAAEPPRILEFKLTAIRGTAVPEYVGTTPSTYRKEN